MTKTGDQRLQKGLSRKHLTSDSFFKYYIHDTAKGYCLALHGPLNEACIKELTCCWNTAKDTLRERSLIVDLRHVTSIDNAAHRWVIDMAAEGATCVPETVLAGKSIVEARREDQPIKNASWLDRLLSAFRTDREFQTRTVNADSARVTGR